MKTDQEMLGCLWRMSIDGHHAIEGLISMYYFCLLLEGSLNAIRDSDRYIHNDRIAVNYSGISLNLKKP